MRNIPTPALKQAHPRLYAALELFWGSREFKEYLDKTVMTTSDRVIRQGFPPQVIRELFYLQRQHDMQFPQFTTTCKWDMV